MSAKDWKIVRVECVVPADWRLEDAGRMIRDQLIYKPADGVTTCGIMSMDPMTEAEYTDYGPSIEPGGTND